MYKVSTHSNHLLVKAGRPRTFPLVGTSNSIEPSSKRSTSAHDGSNSSESSNPSPEMMTSPKPVFKKSPSKQSYQNGQSQHLSQNHEDMLRFVHSSWQQVMQEYESAREQGNGKVVYYDHTVSNNNNNVLSDFKPLDLEKWFVQRMLHTMDIDPSITAWIRWFDMIARISSTMVESGPLFFFMDLSFPPSRSSFSADCTFLIFEHHTIVFVFAYCGDRFDVGC